MRRERIRRSAAQSRKERGGEPPPLPLLQLGGIASKKTRGSRPTDGRQCAVLLCLLQPHSRSRSISCPGQTGLSFNGRVQPTETGRASFPQENSTNRRQECTGTLLQSALLTQRIWWKEVAEKDKFYVRRV